VARRSPEVWASGGNPQIGKKACRKSVDMIHELWPERIMFFITAGMGGGTGTGACPIIAGIAKNWALNNRDRRKALYLLRVKGG